MLDLERLSGVSTAPVEREQADRKARFCLATGVAPSEYDRLTQWEIEAFADAVQEREKHRG